MTDREVILGVLGRIARRLWVKRALQELGFSLSVILFSLVAFQLAWPELSVALGPSSSVTFAVAAATGMAFALWRANSRATLALAAGAADRGGRLNDELKTAYWLLIDRDVSAIGELQVERAARTARRLDPRRIVPARAPADLWVAGALALVLAVTSSLAPRISLSWDAVPGETADAPASLRSLLEGARDDEPLRRLDQALAALERPEVPAEQWQRALLQAREAVDEANLRAVAARESLSRVAAALRAQARLHEIASALEEGRTRDAVDSLKTLAAESADRPHDSDSEGWVQSQDGAWPESAGDETGERAHRQALRVDQDALSKVIKNIEAAHEALESQRRANEVGRRMEDFLVAASQRGALTASQFGTRASAPNPTPAPETGKADLQGATMYRQGAVARDADADPQEGSRAGTATGQSEAIELEGARTQRLDARLKLEVLRAGNSPEAGDDRRGQASWHYQPTRGGEAKTGFASLREREHFAQARAMTAERVDLRNRQSVREYFVKLHESDTK